MLHGFYEFHEAGHAIAAQGKSRENFLEVLAALVRFGLIEPTDHIEYSGKIGADVQSDQSTLVFVRVHHRTSVFRKGRTAVPAPDFNSGLDAQGASSDRGLQHRDREPLPALPIQSPLCDCGERTPCHSSECYHPWRRAMVVRDRLDISQHK